MPHQEPKRGFRGSSSLATVSGHQPGMLGSIPRACLGREVIGMSSLAEVAREYAKARKGLETAFEEARKRHEAGFEVYGAEGWKSPAAVSIQDMKEEALDLINYGAMLHHKLCRLEESIKSIKDRLWGPPQDERD